MSVELELQIRLCPRGHVLLCFGGRQLRLSPRGFRQLTEAANRIVKRLDTMEEGPKGLLN